MEAIPRFSVRQPVVVHMLTLLALIGGVIAYQRITLESFPLMTTDIVTVFTAYPNASPSEVETLVTFPIEEKLKDLSIIDELRSVSIEGRSALTIKLKPDVQDLSKATLDITNRVNQALLPEGVRDDPVVTEVAREWPVMGLAISGGADFLILKRAAEDLRDALLQLPDVSGVELKGLRDREVWVEIDPVKLRHYRLGLDEVVRAIRDRHVNLPGGAVKEPTEEVILRTVGELGSSREIGEVVVAGIGPGSVRLADIAVVKDTFEEPTRFGRMDGRRSINLTVTKPKLGNTIRLVDQIRAFLVEYRKKLPGSLRVDVTMDGSERIRKRLNTMLGNGWMGLVLVLLLLWFFLDLRLAVMAALGIVVSFLATLIFMYWMGTSLNMVSMFGLIIVLGMIVDDTIVVCENIYRYMQQGMEPVRAAIHGTAEVFWPVVAAVSTSIAAFMPLLMMHGMMGKFLRWIPIVVSLALLASLIEAFVVLPSHMADFARVPKQRKEKRWFKGLRSFYTYVLVRSLRGRYVLAVVLPLVTAGLLWGGVKLLGFVLFPRSTMSSVSLKVTTPVGTELAQTEKVVAAVERAALTLPEHAIESVESTVGEAGGRGNRERGSHLARIKIELSDPDDRPDLPGPKLIGRVRGMLKGVKGAESIEFQRSWHGPSQGRAVEVRIQGGSLEILTTLSSRLQRFLGTLPGVKDISDDLQAGKAEARVIVDETLAKARGLDARQVAGAVRTAFGGLVAAKLQTGREEVDIRVRLAESFRKDTANVRLLSFKSRDGLVPFPAIARIERGTGLSRINRFDGRRVVTVTADVEEGKTTSFEVNQQVAAEVDRLSAEFPGYQFGLGGQEEERVKSLRSMVQAFGLSMLLIFCILGALFRSFLQPLVVMTVIPLGFIGVMYGLFVHGQPIGLMAIIGTIALSGVVVNDSLVYIEFINGLRAKGVGRMAACVIAGRQRLRPILLTTITTVLGLTPMVMEWGGSSSFLAPMAIAIVWGLSFATALTLLVIPALYLIADDLRRWCGFKEQHVTP